MIERVNIHHCAPAPISKKRMHTKLTRCCAAPIPIIFDDVYGWIYIVCSHCGESVHARNLQRAIRKWNRRQVRKLKCRDCVWQGRSPYEPRPK